MSSGGIMSFGRAWLAFAIALACHVVDEATHDFLSIYNPNALAIRARFPFLPIPTFTFRTWIMGLGAAVVLLLCLTPLAARGTRWIRIAAVPLGIVVGILNGTMHIASSFYMHRLMPGVLSAPVLIATGVWLVSRSRHTMAARRVGA
jgi:uncharacterized protein with HXXEE motif